MLDDRDIICETDYSPLSNEELAAQIEWHAVAMSGATAYDLERITGPARALLARAEAAEVGRDEANLKALQAEYRIIQLEARVAELEAALVGMDGHMARLLLERNDALNRVDELEAAQAAQQWRPGNAEPPVHGWYWVYDFDEDDAPTRRFYGPQGWGMHGDEAAPDWHMAIAPLPQEPTP